MTEEVKVLLFFFILLVIAIYTFVRELIREIWHYDIEEHVADYLKDKIRR